MFAVHSVLGNSLHTLAVHSVLGNSLHTLAVHSVLGNSLHTQPSASGLLRVAIGIPGIPQEARLSISGGDTVHLHRSPRIGEVYPETPPGAQRSQGGQD